ncbi:unnamed protein product [Coffea canephora]|uniref:DH200=94 genomic scaffold, scaffold_228 n=1 Tax=Coffea canephora TaxID=49390 RepID=A0A068VBX6_COFCA|nr:unnamed protein product [Coffea canephora]
MKEGETVSQAVETEEGRGEMMRKRRRKSIIRVFAISIVRYIMYIVIMLYNIYYICTVKNYYIIYKYY